MSDYNLTPDILSEEDKESIKLSFKESSDKIRRAEMLIKSLGLTEFELHILAKRLQEE